MLSEHALEELAKPLDPKRITVGQNGPLRGIKYLEGEDVIRTANHIFGYGGWSFELLAQPWIVEKGEQGNNHTPYEVWAAHGRLTVSEAHFADVGTCVRNGAGSGGLEMAIKGAVTDCVKRCLRNMGDQFGLILYDKTADMAGIAADFSGASGVDLPPMHPPPTKPLDSSWWDEFRDLCTQKSVTAAALAEVIGAGPTLKTVTAWVEREDKPFTQLVTLAEAKQKELMGVPVG
jgi:hypothetical protein